AVDRYRLLGQLDAEPCGPQVHRLDPPEVLLAPLDPVHRPLRVGHPGNQVGSEQLPHRRHVGRREGGEEALDRRGCAHFYGFGGCWLGAALGLSSPGAPGSLIAAAAPLALSVSEPLPLAMSVSSEASSLSESTPPRSSTIFLPLLK